MPEETEEDHYAPPKTLLGLLQRGRGEGALRAAADPATAADLVYACVRREWSWDSLVDDRSLYLARLLRDLELPLGPVIEVLTTGDEYDSDRAAEILQRLARGGSEEAQEAVRTHVREQEPWPDIRKKQQPPNPLAELEIPKLLALLADPDTSEDQKTEALRVLRRRAPEPGLIPLVPSLVTADGERPLVLLIGNIRKLGALAVPAARDWAASDTRWLAWQGLSVLAEHGEEQDIPALVAELKRDWADGTWCGPERMARGLAHFGTKAAAAAAAEAVPLLRRYWMLTPHSYERPAYLEALAALDPAGLDTAYAESLWDCQDDARLLAVRHAPDRPHVRDRLAHLRDDPMEEPEVRTAAAARLAGLT
ncbi:hypothetical protein ACH4E7_36905 [Kitasatospora sp. NPDC018058]|uniref:hypothetical protein n=1 Tax=Kitasatospora sp. NPDC018058 TaxID=3364025 RepID=UPI0037BF86E7